MSETDKDPSDKVECLRVADLPPLRRLILHRLLQIVAEINAGERVREPSVKDAVDITMETTVGKESMQVAIIVHIPNSTKMAAAVKEVMKRREAATSQPPTET